MISIRSAAPHTRTKLVTELRRMLKNRCQNAYLFGSYARNEAHAGSDVDLIIVADTKRTFVDRFRDYFDLLYRFAPIDLVVYTPSEWESFENEPNLLLQHAKDEMLPLWNRKH